MTGQIQTELPIWLASIGLMLAIFLAWYSYSGARSKELFSKSRRTGLAIIRAIGFFLVFLLFMGFLWKGQTEMKDKPIDLVAVDNSLSMMLTDDSLDLKNDIGAFIGNLNHTLEDKSDLRYYGFGQNVQQGSSFDFSDKKTDFKQLFDHLGSVYRRQHVRGLLLISDGIFNTGLDPASAAQYFPFPVSVWAVGDTVAMPDLKISDIQLNDVVYAGVNFPVDIKIEGTDLHEYEARLRILSEGKVLADTLVSIDPVDGIGNTSLLINFDKAGNHIFEVRVDAFRNEDNRYNNSSIRTVEVVDEKVRVLLLYNTTHPDIRIFKASLEQTSRYELVVQDITDAYFDLKDYQLVILYQLPDGGAREKPVLDKIMHSDANILFVIGPQTKLSTLTTMGVGVRFKAERIVTEDYEPVYNDKFSLFKNDEGIVDYFQEMPPLKAPFATISLSSRSSVLLYQKIKNIELTDPLLWFAHFQGRKYGFVWGEGIWRWRLFEYLGSDSHYYTDGLIVKIVNYLSTNEIKDPLRLTVPAVINTTEGLKLSAHLYNKSLEPVTYPEVYFDISDGDAYVRKMTMRKSQDEYKLEIDGLQPGRYNYACYTNLDKKEYRKSGVIDVLDIPLEQLDLTARHDYLRELVSRGDGRFFERDESDKLLSYLKSKELNPETPYTITKWNNIINVPYILAVIILLFSVEWFLRRWSGTR
ncbi:MAG: hypothetical protein J7L96_10225 [Bacteroidales bacterium]|nr:hypothetical protein [Bacteroidales bacterium]